MCDLAKTVKDVTESMKIKCGAAHFREFKRCGGIERFREYLI